MENNSKLDKVCICSGIAPNIGMSHVLFSVFIITFGCELNRIYDISPCCVPVIKGILQCIKNNTNTNFNGRTICLSLSLSRFRVVSL